MVEAFIVYFGLLILLLFISSMGKFSFSTIDDIKEPDSLYSENKTYKTISIISVIVFTFVIGLRYYVGGDYAVYLSSFNNLDISSIDNSEHYEPAYFFLMVGLKYLGISFPFLFIITAFLQIFFIFKWAANYKYLLTWIIYFYFTSLYLFDSMNIVRQAIAFSLILYSITYIYKSDFIRFCLVIFFAYLFHKSAIIFLPFYFFLKYDWIKRKYIQLVLLIIFYILSDFIVDIFFNKVVVLSNILNYEYSSVFKGDEFYFENSEFSLGIGTYFMLAINCTIILYSDKLKDFFKEQHYIAYHNLFLIGAFLSFAVEKSNSIVFSRFLFYFSSIRLVLLGFLCYYLFSVSKDKNSKIIGVLILFFYLLWFISAITKGAAWCSPFQFVFQDFIPYEWR